MTLPEFLGAAAASVVAAVGTYGTFTAKLNNLIGKKEAPGDDSLRDIVMKIAGKIDAQHGATTDQLREIDRRLELVEARVFTPPARAAIRALPPK